LEKSFERQIRAFSRAFSPILYSTLPELVSSKLLNFQLFEMGSRLQGHPGLDVELPGIETSSGSLGQGISIAVGMAISSKYLDKNGKHIFSITGDGELEEGSVWEAAMSASNFKLSNFCWIVDNNDCQIDGRVENVMNIYPLDKKFEAFGFNVLIIDGNNIEEIIRAFDQFKWNAKNTEKPTCIIAKTIMAKVFHLWKINTPAWKS